MANELVLTQEEKELIEKRRLREARKNKKATELVKEAFKKLPTLAGLLRMLNVSVNDETARDCKTHLHDIHVDTEGKLVCSGSWYVRDTTENAAALCEVRFDKLNKICGKKLPFDCALEVGVINDKVVVFRIRVIDRNVFHYGWSLGHPLVEACALSHSSGRYWSISDNDEYSMSLIELDKASIKAKLMQNIQLYCSNIYEHLEDSIRRRQEELNAALEKRQQIKQILGSYYKPKERKED